MIEKRVIDSKRIRKINGQHPFSGVEHEYNRYRENNRLTPVDDHMYLFFISVSDSDGMSYFSGAKIQKYLGIGWGKFSTSLEKLVSLGLIKYEKRDNHLAVQILQVPDWEIAQYRFQVNNIINNVTVQTVMTEEQYNNIMRQFELQLANNPTPETKDVILNRMVATQKDWDTAQLASLKKRK